MTEPWVTGVIQPVMRTARRKFGPCGTFRDVERVDGPGRTFLSVEVLRQETLRNPGRFTHRTGLSPHLHVLHQRYLQFLI